MKPERFARLKRLLLQAVDLPEREREAYLDQACGDDPELRREAEVILARSAKPSALFRKASDIPEMDAEPGGAAPTIQTLPAEIGGYRIIRKLGEGGMGVVYEAEQQSPQRRVALKVVRGGTFLDEHRVRLFQREIQALARLKHPGIANIHESGRTESGEHFFAMELVSGEPLDTYLENNPIPADQARSAIRTRLELFCQICHCVSYAHQRGVIHRDLKPSNIFVVSEEELQQGGSTGSAVQVKILDFGLARITDADVSMTTMLTEVGKIQGTLAYMSPEQARGNPDEIDVRSDVYSLGVILYEMLTGELPYDVRRTMVHEAVRVILKEPPKRPSTISRILRGDVETVVLKALEKDPLRRYQSVASLGEDVERYLAHQTIVARPPSTAYQLRKLITRHRKLFGALAVMFVLLAGGLVASTLMYLKSENARAEAVAVTDFLKDTLTAVAPVRARGHEVTVREQLDNASQKIDEAFPGQPRVEATLRFTIASTYSVLGEYAVAELHLEKALEIRKRELGEGHPDTLEVTTILGWIYYFQGRYAEREPLFTQALEISRHELGEEHQVTIGLMILLGARYDKQCRYDEAEPLFEDALANSRRALGDEHSRTLEAMMALGTAYQKQFKFDEAEELHSSAYESLRRVRGEEDQITLMTMINLAYLYGQMERFDEGEQLFGQILEIERRALGEDHLLLYETLDGLGTLKYIQKSYSESEQYFLEAQQGFLRLMSEEHPSTLRNRTNLVRLRIAQKLYDEAEPLCLHVLDTQRRVLGEEHLETLWNTQALGMIYREQGFYEKAEPLFITAVEGARRVLPGGNWRIGRYLLEQGRCRLALKRYAEAEAGLLEAYEILIDAPVPERKHATGVVETLIDLNDAWGKPEKAAEWRAKLAEAEAELSSLQTETVSE